MRPESIFGPMAVLALWTLGVVFLTGFRRVQAARAGRVRPGAFRLGEDPEVPDDVKVVNRNLMNLLEVPVLFYVVCLGCYVTRPGTSTSARSLWPGPSWGYGWLIRSFTSLRTASSQG
jgi:hypothetical protein